MSIAEVHVHRLKRGHLVVKPSHTIRPTFDDPNVVSDAGVVPALRLGESAGLYDLLEEALTVDSPAPRVCTPMASGSTSADPLSLSA